MKRLPQTIAYVLLLIPIAFLLVFTVGEVASGDLSGLSHIIQMLPFILLILFARRHPRPAGIILIILSLLLIALYMTRTSFALPTKLLVSGILFGVPLVSGILFVAGSNRV